MADANKPQLEDFEDEAVEATPAIAPLGVAIGTHAALALGGFKDFCLNAELSRAITENGFEHPSEVQHQALPKAMLGMDILAQAKAGMGKTAVFVFALLERIEKQEKKHVQAVVVVHARELAHQIEREFKRFNRYLPHCTTAVFFGGVPIGENEKILAKKDDIPAIVVATPGRLGQLVQKKKLDLSHVKWFVVDEFDRCLDDVKMRRDVQSAFLATPKDKQVMMFSATMTAELHTVALKFMNNPCEILVDSQSKLTLHGLSQWFMEITEAQKLRKLCDLLDVIEFNQVIIFCSSVERTMALNIQLRDLKFPSSAIHSGMSQPERLKVYESSKSNNTRIIVATDLFGRGIDIDKINLVIQFDMASEPDTYLHRVGRAGRFGTKGLTVAFITEDQKVVKYDKREYKDTEVMKVVQERFEIEVNALTDPAAQLNQSQYMNQ
jgi:ATP-dependent RNA helicase UAP56/SUB2